MKLKINVITILLIFCCCKLLSAQITPNTNGIVFVHKDVVGGNASGGSWSNAVPELADALIAAHSNANIQQIWVAQGTYSPKYSAGMDGIDPWMQFGSPTSGPAASFVMVNNVKLYGGFLNATETSTAQRDTINNNTILTGLDAFVHVVISVGTTGSELNGFTIKDGNAIPYQELYVNGLGTLGTLGGGVYMQTSDLKIKNCVIRDNHASSGAGIYAHNSTLVLENTEVIYNQTNANTGTQSQGTSTAQGGGIYFLAGISLNIDSCNISNNYATAEHYRAYGAGLFVPQNSSAVSISNTQFSNNIIELILPSGAQPTSLMARGAGLCLITSQFSNINNCTFLNNEIIIQAANATLSSTYSNYVDGAGVLTGSPAVFNNCRIANNKITANLNPSNTPQGWCAGAGIMCDAALINGQPVGEATAANTTLNNCTIENNSILGNFAPSGGGIGFNVLIHLSPSATRPKINNSIIRHNSATKGGAIHTFSLPPIVKNTLFENNTASEGSIIYNEGPQASQPKFINCTMVKNTGNATSASLFANYEGAITTLKNSIIFNNAGVFSTGTTNAEYSLIEGNTVYPGIGNINLNPQFSNASNGDYTLLNTSPAANAGSEFAYTAVGNILSDTDLMGNPRLYEDTIDMGAHELQKPSIDTTTNILSRFKNSNHFKIFPNPSHVGGEFLVELNYPELDIRGAKLSVFNFLGQTIQMKTLNQKITKINTPSTSGNYRVVIIFSNGSILHNNLTVR